MKLTLTIIPLLFLIITSCEDSNSQKKQLPERTERTESTPAVDSMEILYPSFWVYGRANDSKDHQRQIVDAWYKFRFIIKSSRCTDTPRDDTDKHNEFTDSIMSARIGKNWYQKFEKSVDSLYAIDTLAISIAQANHVILHFDTITEKYNDQYKFYPNLQYTSHATGDDHIKVVTIEGYGVVYNATTFVNYLRATVDLKRKKVINIDKTAYSNW